MSVFQLGGGAKVRRPGDRDGVGGLPESAAKKIKTMRRLMEDRWAISRAASDKVHGELRPEVENRKLAISRLIRPGGEFGPQVGARGENDPSVVAARKELADAEEDLRDAQARHHEAARVSGELRGLIEEIERYLTRHGHGGIVAHTGPVLPALRKGETREQAVERLRHRLAELDADAHRVRSAPRPAAEAKAAARAQLEELAERGAPKVGELVEPDGRGGLEFTPVNIPQNAYVGQALGGYAVAAPDAVGLVAWLLRDQLIDAVEAEIDEYANFDEALTARERAEKLAEVGRDRLAVEREEEALIEAIEAGGQHFSRRRNADPRAILHLGDAMPAPAES